LIVIGKSRVGGQLDKALTRADKSIQREVDANRKDFENALDEAQKELAEQAAATAS
jgi:ABC-type Zn2+ transport system substrate-binding protein/surface adhesin